MSHEMKKVYFGSNLKMYKTNQGTLDYLTRLDQLTQDIPNEYLELFILPSYTALADSCRAIDQSRIRLGAQNVHWELEGPFTGEISVSMLNEVGVNLAMIGHAERREKFGETNEITRRRVLTCLKHGFQIILCVGDSARDKAHGVTEENIALQLRTALSGVEVHQLSKVWVAYEPVWAIGEGGTVASTEYANSIHHYLHQLLEDKFPEVGGKVPVLYGGSVNLDNAADLIVQPYIDGLFIGRAAWDADIFYSIIRSSLEAIS